MLVVGKGVGPAIDNHGLQIGAREGVGVGIGVALGAELSTVAVLQQYRPVDEYFHAQFGLLFAQEGQIIGGPVIGADLVGKALFEIGLDAGDRAVAHFGGEFELELFIDAANQWPKAGVHEADRVKTSGAGGLDGFADQRQLFIAIEAVDIETEAYAMLALFGRADDVPQIGKSPDLVGAHERMLTRGSSMIRCSAPAAMWAVALATSWA